MRSRTSSFVTLATLLLAACDPTSGIEATATLVPNPTYACVSDVIGSLGELSRREAPPRDAAGRVLGRGDFNLRMVGADSTLGTAVAKLEPSGDSLAVFSLRFEWIGRLTARPDSARALLAERAVGIATAVRARCATPSTEPPTCRQYGKGAPDDGKCVTSTR